MDALATDVLLPAHHTWQATIDCLEIFLGEDFPGREGSGWFAICLWILTAERLPVAGRLLRRADREPDRLGPGSAARVPAEAKHPLEGLPGGRPAATAPSAPHLQHRGLRGSTSRRQDIQLVTSPTTATDQSYADLRARMVSYLVETTGDARTAAVIKALSAVPRHLVIDDTDRVDPADTYDPEGIVATKKDADGNTISSVSAARIQAMQLEQADLRVGHRVLEIGSGGVNAAYLAEIVGPEGLVVTVDIDPDVTDRASRFLTRAGYDRVVVVTGDGVNGSHAHAPFDRILVTVEAADIPPAWWDQLADDGLIVAPLRMGGMTRTVALTRAADDVDLLFSDDLQLCGFVPMQGAGTNPQDVVTLNESVDARVALRFDGGAADAFDADGLAAVLHGPSTVRWTGVQMGGSESLEHLDLWLATTLAPALTLAPTRGAIDAGLVAAALPFNAPTLVDGTSFAYRTLRATDDPDVWEIGIVAHGPDADVVATRYLEEIAAWAVGRPANAVVHVSRLGATDNGSADNLAPDEGREVPPASTPFAAVRTIQRAHTRVTIAWPLSPPPDDRRATGGTVSPDLAALGWKPTDNATSASQDEGAHR